MGIPRSFVMCACVSGASSIRGRDRELGALCSRWCRRRGEPGPLNMFKLIAAAAAAAVEV